MKKMVLILGVALLLLILIGTGSMASVTMKVGYDYFGYYKVGGSSTEVTSGYSVAFELIGNPSEKMEWGVGVEAEMKRKLKNTDDGFQFIPVYVMINYYTSPEGSSPYFTGRLGYNLLIADYNFKKGNQSTRGSAYYAVGGGYRLGENNRIEVIYSANNGTVGGTNFQYNRVTISFGHSF